MNSPAYLEAALDLDLAKDFICLGLYMRLYHGTPQEEFKDALSPVKWRPLKRLMLARAMHVSEITITRAMNKLVRLGYVERMREGRAPGTTGGSGQRVFRLAHDRLDKVTASTYPMGYLQEAKRGA